jgi:hypothetical protein
MAQQVTRRDLDSELLNRPASRSSRRAPPALPGAPLEIETATPRTTGQLLWRQGGGTCGEGSGVHNFEPVKSYGEHVTAI